MRIHSALPPVPLPGAAARPTDPIPPDPPAAPEAAPPNPTLRIEPALGLVVLELHGPGGETRTIPSERELEAYRSAARQAGPRAGGDGDQTSSPPAGSPTPGSATGPAAREAPPTASR